VGGQVSNATTLIDDFYGKVRAFVAMTLSSLPDLPNTCECGSQDFILTELLYERSSSVVSCEDDGTLTGYTDGHSDYLDTNAVPIIYCSECDTAYNGNRQHEIVWS